MKRNSRKPGGPLSLGTLSLVGCFLILACGTSKLRAGEPSEELFGLGVGPAVEAVSLSTAETFGLPSARADVSLHCPSGQCPINIPLAAEPLSPSGASGTIRQPSAVLIQSPVQQVNCPTCPQAAAVAPSRVVVRQTPAAGFGSVGSAVVRQRVRSWQPGALVRRVLDRVQTRIQYRAAPVRSCPSCPTSSNHFVGGNNMVAANWPWPGGTEQSLRRHLAGWPHHLDTSGMSYSQIVAHHNHEHERIGPVSAAQLARHNGR